MFDDDATDAEKRAAYDDIAINGAALDDFSLDFTLLGTSIELKAGGSDTAVDMSNVEEYISLGACPFRRSWLCPPLPLDS